MDVAGVIDFDGLRTEDFGHELIDEEGVLGGDDVIAGLEEGVADELDDFIAAAADDEVAHFQIKLLGERLTQAIRRTVGIDVDVFDRITHGDDGLGAGAERVFVGGELDDVLRFEAEFACHIFDGFAGFVGDEVFELRVGVVPDGHGWRREKGCFLRLGMVLWQAREQVRSDRRSKVRVPILNVFICEVAGTACSAHDCRPEFRPCLLPPSHAPTARHLSRFR